jgi:hypothetical protein
MGQVSKTDGSMYQVSFGSDDTVWVADFNGHRVHHFKQSGELITTIGTGTAGNARTSGAELSQAHGCVPCGQQQLYC